MPVYDLINPRILGNFNTSYNVENGLEAAKTFWNDLSQHITNNMPELIITFKNDRDDLYHYKITEKISGGSKTADTVIKEIKPKISQKVKRDFLNEVSRVQQNITNQMVNQEGGKSSKRYKGKSDSSSSSSSSSSSLSSDAEEGNDYYDFSRYKRLSQPIMYWWYTPILYRTPRIYTPTFTVPLMPYIRTWIPYY